MELKKFKAFTRENLKKNANRKLRSQGMVPGVLYGQNKPQVNLKFDPKKLIASLDPEKKRNTYLDLEVEGGETVNAIIRDVQFDCLSGDMIHVDFFRISPEERITVTVPFKMVGKSVGEKLGGISRQVLRDLSITCPVSIIPAALTYDVTPLNIDDVIRISDLQVPEGVTVNIPGRQALVQVKTARGAQEEVAEGEEEEEAAAPAAE